MDHRPDVNWQLRGAKSSDAEFILRVLDMSIGPYMREAGVWDEAQERRNVGMLLETADVSIIESAGRDVGYLAVWRKDDAIYLASVALSSDFQRRGLGGSVIRKVIDEAEACSLPLRLSVASNNPAKRLYERLGFVVTERDGHKLRMERAAGDTATQERPSRFDM